VIDLDGDNNGKGGGDGGDGGDGFARISQLSKNFSTNVFLRHGNNDGR